MRAGQLKLKIQLICGEDLAIGPGKADLLEAIDQEGSISGGGRAMGMSYRRTWLLVDTMNRCWTTPLVEATPGGGQQKGARLTDAGRQVLAAYRDLETQLLGAAHSPALGVLSTLLLPEPRPARQGVSPDTPSDAKSAGRSRRTSP